MTRPCMLVVKQMSLRDMVTLSRVQTQVNKTAILAFSHHNIHRHISLNVLSTEDLQPALMNTESSLQSSDNLKYLRINFKDVSRRL